MGRSCDYARRLCLLWNHRWDSNTAEKREVGDSAVDKEFDSHATNERRQTGLDGPYHNQEKPTGESVAGYQEKQWPNLF